MIELSRTVRFCLNDPDPARPQRPPRDNAFSAWPPMRGLGRFYQVHVRCAGRADPVTGYFISIKHIDHAVATTILPYLHELLTQTGSSATLPMGQLMRSILGLVQEPLGQTVVQVCLDLTPYHCLTIRSRDMDKVLIRQQYEFAAAHRLHTDRLSDDENRQVFGKCNNPSGHGHNYRLEVAVTAPVDPGGHVTPVEALDALVHEVVLGKLDHRHLNHDVPQFADLNPSVENIAVVIYGMIREQVGRLGVALEEVSVWETDKTVCTYRGPEAMQ